MDSAIDAWLGAVADRHTRDLTRPEFLKAVRALSSRYVESRAALATRSPLDSAGKRAAFAAFYAPLHFLTMREIAARIGPASRPLDAIVDLGCGTGAAGAAWALAQSAHGPAPALRGVDRNAWAVSEALWTWQQLGCRGSARRGDLVDAAARLAGDAPRGRSLAGTGILLAWAVNELADAPRRQLLTAVQAAVARGAALLLVEPLARHASPWWPAWSAALAGAGAREQDMKFADAPLPETLAALNEAAGFSPRTLSARTLAIP